MITGYLKLANTQLLQEIICFVDWSQSTKSAGAIIFTKDYENQQCHIGYVWSRLLTSVFDNKSPAVCELASVVLFLLSNRYLLGGRCVSIWLDNLVAASILRRRLTSVDTFDNHVVNRLLMSIINYPFQIYYVNSKGNVSDFVSRKMSSTQESYQFILDNSNSISDLGVIDKECYEADPDIYAYLKRNKHNANIVKKNIECVYDVDDFRKRFNSTHTFADDTSETLAHPLDTILLDEIDIMVESPSSDLKRWMELSDTEIVFTVPEELPLLNWKVENLFKTSADKLHDNPIYTEDGSDFIDYLVGDSLANPLGEEEMKVLRQDSHFIAKNDDLVMSILNGMDGLIDNEIMSSRMILSVYLQELNVITQLLEKNDKSIENEPLFDSWEELKETVRKYKLTDNCSRKFNYFIEIQKRSTAISLMKKIFGRNRR